jgi:hypothetical protein
MNYSDRFLRETASYSALDVMLADIGIRIQLTPTDYQAAIDHYEAINEWIDRELSGSDSAAPSSTGLAEGWAFSHPLD